MSGKSILFQKFDPLWDYFSGSGYDSRLLKDIGVITPEQYDIFMKVFYSPKDQIGTDNAILLSPKKMEEGFYSNTSLQPVFDFWAHAALPLKIRRWELGMGFEPEAFIPLISLEGVRKKILAPAFKKSEVIRWQTYISFITNVIISLQDDSFLMHYTPHCDARSLKKVHEQADDLNERLCDLLSGVGEYFFSRDTIWYVHGEKRENLKEMFLRFSRVFDFKAEQLSKFQLLQREKKILDLLDEAIVLYPAKTLSEKMKLFDVIPELRVNVDGLLKYEQKMEGQRNKSALGKSLKKRKDEVRFDSEKKSLTQNLSSLFLAREEADLTCFCSLGILSQEELEILIENFEEPSFLLALNDTKQLNTFKKVCDALSKKGILNDVDMVGAVSILKQISPVLSLRANQFSVFGFGKDTAVDLENEIKLRQRVGAFNRNDLQRFEFLSFCIAATIQDLETKSDGRSLKGAADLQGNMTDILNGVPEYFYANAVEKINQTMAGRCSSQELEKHAILLEKISKCFCPVHLNGTFVSSKDIPSRLSALKDLANLSVSMNPVWTDKQKDDFWYAISQMSVQKVSYHIPYSGMLYQGKWRIYG